MGKNKCLKCSSKNLEEHGAFDRCIDCGGMNIFPISQTILISNEYEYWEETAEVTPEVVETLKNWKPTTNNN